MCGKFTQMATWREVVAYSEAFTTTTSGEVTTATPMRFANIIKRDASGARVSMPMRWGFSKRTASTPGRPDHMHARAETIDIRATFAPAFAAHRGVLLVHTFNEGEELASGRTKQWTVAPKDGLPLALAVICEEWRNGEESLWTFVQVTVPASPLIGQITDRMPAILQPEDWPLWLGETPASAAELKALLKPHAADAQSWAFAPEVKAPKPRPARSDLFS